MVQCGTGIATSHDEAISTFYYTSTMTALESIKVMKNHKSWIREFLKNFVWGDRTGKFC